MRAHEQQGRVSSAAELERRRDWEALVQAAPVAIWVALDPDCRVVKGNPAAAALMRLPAAANPSTTSTEAALHQTGARVHIEGRYTATAELPMQTAARTRRAVPHQELEFRFPDGSSNWAYGNAVPLFDANNEVRGAIGSFIDVTALKHAERSLRDADRRKDEFLAVLAHELRNPLAPIRNAVAILRLKEPATPELQWARDVIDRQVVQMARLIDDLLDLSRISHGKIALKRERVELAAIVHAAVEGSRPLIDERRHELTVDVPQEPIYLDADATRLAQSLCNLLNNAAKYTDGGGRIRLHAQQRTGEVIVSVRDNGIGIPPDMLSRVFEMFTQLDRASDRAQGGLGIGLTLVKRVVEMHDGQVEARSAGRGMGSEFVVRMPTLDIVRCAPLAVQRRTAAVARAPRSQRVLVVDDNRDAVDSLQIMLGMTGSDVRAVYDGVEAVRVAEYFRPNVVVLDLSMPGVDGYETARALRAGKGGADLVLIAVTGWGQAEDHVRSKAAGFHYHLVKPVGTDSLVELLASLPVRQELIA